MPRDRIAELQTMKQRAGGKYKRCPSYQDMVNLKSSWQANSQSFSELTALVPVRAVTLLEVFLRRWLERLIDKGAPYVERASKLNLNLKFDFPIAKGLQGGVVTFGELFAHSVSLSEMSSICSTFDKILDEDLFEAIRNTRNRWEERQNGRVGEPIIPDINAVRNSIARLLEVRHILVHEFPLESPSTDVELSSLVDNATLFLQAADEHFANLLFPNYPMTQAEMNNQAAHDYAACQDELEKICSQIKENTGREEIDEVQKHWSAFRDAEAERQAQRHLGGTIRGMLYSLGAMNITMARIKELKNWIEDPGD
jgi:uncharacterized protein YecT (DUF1311 family)